MSELESTCLALSTPALLPQNGPDADSDSGSTALVVFLQFLFTGTKTYYLHLKAKI